MKLTCSDAPKAQLLRTLLTSYTSRPSILAGYTERFVILTIAGEPPSSTGSDLASTLPRKDSAASISHHIRGGCTLCSTAVAGKKPTWHVLVCIAAAATPHFGDLMGVDQGFEANIGIVKGSRAIHRDHKSALGLYAAVLPTTIGRP